MDGICIYVQKYIKIPIIPGTLFEHFVNFLLKHAAYFCK